MSAPTTTSSDLIALLVAQCADHAIVLLDAAGRVTAWLGAARHIFGYEASEIQGQPLDRLFTPEDRARGVPAHELEVARATGWADDDRWQLRKNGSRVWVSGSVTALTDAAGAIVGFGKIMRDRTDVRARIDTLESRIRAVAGADERMKVFVATLAHELRNPLSPLVNALEVVRRSGAITHPLARPLEIMERQVGHIRRLVDDLLDMTRLNQGKMQIARVPVDLRDILTTAADVWRPLAERRQQTLRVLLVPSPMVVDGDADRLRQVFVNLLSNAIKYTPAGGHIWVQATIDDAEAVVRVQDDGVGIAPEMLPRIFELFTQEESSRGMAAGGLGLGLPLVRELVALHGGSVQVRSEGKDKGTEFTVRLPVTSR